MNKGYEMSKHVKEFMLINEKRLNVIVLKTGERNERNDLIG